MYVKGQAVVINLHVRPNICHLE